MYVLTYVSMCVWAYQRMLERVHEYLHGLTLPHSFSYTEWTNYVYEAMATDNIMDYSHLEKDPVSGNARNPINPFQLWKWQWETIRKHYLLK